MYWVFGGVGYLVLCICYLGFCVWYLRCVFGIWGLYLLFEVVYLLFGGVYLVFWFMCLVLQFGDVFGNV